MAEFWAEWGGLAYVGAALWAFFEGETFVLLASAAGAATGLIDPWMLMASVWLGSYAGDQLWFTLGRRYGAQAVRRLPGAERQLAHALHFLEKFGVAFVLTFRFAYGVRNVASAACGVAGMDWGRFAALNFIAAGIWAASFVAAGWFLGEWMGAGSLSWLLGGLGLVLVGGLGVKMWHLRRRVARTTPAL